MWRENFNKGSKNRRGWVGHISPFTILDRIKNQDVNCDNTRNNKKVRVAGNSKGAPVLYEETMASLIYSPFVRTHDKNPSCMPHVYMKYILMWYNPFSPQLWADIIMEKDNIYTYRKDVCRTYVRLYMHNNLHEKKARNVI